MASGHSDVGIYWDGFRISAWVMLAASAVTAVALAFDGAIINALWFSGMVAVVYAAVFVLKDLPPLFAVILILSDIFAAGVWVWHANRAVVFYDEVLHAFATFAITSAFAHAAYYPLRRELLNRPALMALAVITFGLGAGAAWEIIEWLGFSNFDASMVSSRADTVSDLALDGLGALFAYLLVKRAYRVAVEMRPTK